MRDDGSLSRTVQDLNTNGKGTQVERKQRKPNYVCTKCSKEIYGSYANHWDKFHPEVHRREMYQNGLRCKHCPRYFGTQRTLNDHLRSHLILATTGVKPGFEPPFLRRKKRKQASRAPTKKLTRIGCTQCKLKIWHGKKYTEHWNQHHLHLNPSEMYKYSQIPCTYCPRLFQFEDLLFLHQRRMHKKEFQVLAANGKVPVSQHLATGTHKFGRPNTRCRKCGYKIIHALDYETHWVENHSDVHRTEMYKGGGVPCSYCPRYFQFQSGMETHLRITHHGKETLNTEPVEPLSRSKSSGLRKLKEIISKTCNCKLFCYAADEKYENGEQKQDHKAGGFKMFIAGGVQCSLCRRRSSQSQRGLNCSPIKETLNVFETKIEPEDSIDEEYALNNREKDSSEKEVHLPKDMSEVTAFEPKIESNDGFDEEGTEKGTFETDSSAENKDGAQLPIIAKIYSLKQKTQ